MLSEKHVEMGEITENRERRRENGGISVSKDQKFSS